MSSKLLRYVPIEMHGDEVLVSVTYFYQPAEPDVGYYHDGIEIEQILTQEGRDITRELSDYQIEQIVQHIIGGMRNDD